MCQFFTKGLQGQLGADHARHHARDWGLAETLGRHLKEVEDMHIWFHMASFVF